MLYRGQTKNVSRHFNYYEDWRSAELECPKCHWKGKFEDGEVGYYRELMDCSCPNCDFLEKPVLAVVSYSTLEEMCSSGIPADTRQAERIEQFQRNFRSRKLENKQQLPDVDATCFTLAWDFLEVASERLTLIKLDDRVLFSEPALWEGYERFGEVCKIVREKYGKNVADLVPTPASELHLYGDVLSAPTVVSNFRHKIFAS